MSEIRFIDTEVGRLKVTTIGAGAPAVLWHSMFTDERSWQRVLPLMSGSHLLIVITGPGHGESGDPGGRFGLRQCAQAAGEVLDALGVVEPVDWVGNAWGGHVGLRFAAAYPLRMRSLVTLGAPVVALSTYEQARMRLLFVVHTLLGPTGMVTSPLVETMLSAATRSNDPEAVALFRESFVEQHPVRLRNAVVSVSLRREDLTALLPGINVPTLMITGAQHTGWTPAQNEAAASLMPAARAAVVADAAYLVPLERPAAVVALIQSFWAALGTESAEVQR